MMHGSLCSGIGGFELAAEWNGIETLFNCEKDPFCRKVLKKNFPHAIQYEDLTTTDFSPWRGKINILSAGFPCQPFSLAGLRKGTADYRAIWPSVLRIIREIGPAYFIGENVTGLISLALDEVLSSLEDEGYTTEVFVLPAAGVNAPHRRDRVWIIAYTNSFTWRVRTPFKNESEECQIQERDPMEKLGKPNKIWATPNTHGSGLRRESHWPGESRFSYQASSPNHWQDFPTEPAVCGANDGVPTGLVRNRSKQLKAYGNAIVPQVAYEIFKAITQHALLK